MGKKHFITTRKRVVYMSFRSIIRLAVAKALLLPSLVQ